jgi:DNA-binding NarL/FixJ family response regulator
VRFAERNARELRIGERTVKAHLSNIMLKWDLRDRVQVLIKACRVGIVTI